MIRVLLVEDHRFFQDAFSIVLERAAGDFRMVACATTLAQGREYLLGGGADNIDVAVIDLQLLDGDGTELIGELREGGSEVPVLVLTITEDGEVLDRAKELGADRVLSKRADLKEVIDTLRTLVQDRQ